MASSFDIRCFDKKSLNFDPTGRKWIVFPKTHNLFDRLLGYIASHQDTESGIESSGFFLDVVSDKAAGKAKQLGDIVYENQVRLKVAYGVHHFCTHLNQTERYIALYQQSVGRDENLVIFVKDVSEFARFIAAFAKQIDITNGAAAAAAAQSVAAPVATQPTAELAAEPAKATVAETPAASSEESNKKKKNKNKNKKNNNKEEKEEAKPDEPSAASPTPVVTDPKSAEPEVIVEAKDSTNNNNGKKNKNKNKNNNNSEVKSEESPAAKTEVEPASAESVSPTVTKENANQSETKSAEKKKSKKTDKTSDPTLTDGASAATPSKAEKSKGKITIYDKGRVIVVDKKSSSTPAKTDNSEPITTSDLTESTKSIAPYHNVSEKTASSSISSHMDDDLEEESKKVKTTPKKPATETATHSSDPVAPSTPPRNKDINSTDTAVAPVATTEAGNNKSSNKKNKKSLRDRDYRNNDSSANTNHTDLPIQETPSKAIEEEFTSMTSESKM